MKLPLEMALVRLALGVICLTVQTRASLDETTASPSHEPSEYVSEEPSLSQSPSQEPSQSHSPSNEPTDVPTHVPTRSPSQVPTHVPTNSPSQSPTHEPSSQECAVFQYQFSQLGSDLDGEAAEDTSGRSVSLSSDGGTVAIGAPLNDDNGSVAGHVRIYTYDRALAGWTQLGSDLDGEATGDFSGTSTSLSSNGRTVAIGAFGNQGSGPSSGHVRVYTYDETLEDWIQVGADLDGEPFDELGEVSLSADGGTLAAGAFGFETHIVRVYRYNKSLGYWTQLGWDLGLGSSDDYMGGSLSLASDGQTVAIGAPLTDGNGISSGNVRVYSYDATLDGWTQLGFDLYGEAAYDYAGWAVSLSADGRTVAIGADGNDGSGYDAGHVRVYTYNEGSDDWIQLGSDLDGEAALDNSGRSVSLSSDGRTVAIGSTLNDGNGLNSGHVRLFTYDLAFHDWAQLGPDLDGEEASDFSGGSVSLSSDGSTVAIGATRNNGNGFDSGHVRVFELTCNLSATAMPTASPTTEQPSRSPTSHPTQSPSQEPTTAVPTTSLSPTTQPQLPTDDCSLFQYSFFQLGLDLDGEAMGDGSGKSVSLSSDGSTVAIGADGNDGNGSWAGHVRVYTYDVISGGWTQLGSDLDGMAYDQKGSAVSLSSDGRTVAVGAIGSNSGYVSVYIYDSTLGGWPQLGSDLDGEADGDFSGEAVSLSSNGRTVAIGAIGNDGSNGNNYYSGHVRVYTYSENLGDWTQLGSDLDGENAYDYFGESVSLSSDGRTVAIGADGSDGNGYDAGHVRVYFYNEGLGDWTQLGSDLDGEYGDGMGGSVSLSSDGRKLAVGAPGDIVGLARVYTFDTLLGAWVQLGSDLSGETVFDNLGTSVSLSSDGLTVAIGADGNDGNGDESGHVQLYAYSNSLEDWTQLGLDLDGESEWDGSGGAVSLSSDGRTVAIGAPYNGGNGINSGHVRVYRLTCNLSSTAMPTASPITASPSQETTSKPGDDDDDGGGPCIDLPFLDSFGDGCEWYDAHPQDCHPDQCKAYENAAGETACEKCCVCTDCEDKDQGWRDNNGNGCDWYANNSCWGGSADPGNTAWENCCVCGGGNR